MIGLNFIARLIGLLLTFLVVVGFVLGLSVMISWLIRFVWDVFEKNWELQASWMISKFKPRRFHKGLLIPFVFGSIVLCIILFFIMVMISSKGAEGESIGALIWQMTRFK